MNDFRTLPTVAAGGFTLATLGPQLAAAVPVLAPVLLGAVVLGLLLRAVSDDDDKAERTAAEAAETQAAEAERQRQIRVAEILRQNRIRWAKEDAEREAARRRAVAAKLPLGNPPAPVAVAPAPARQSAATVASIVPLRDFVSPSPVSGTRRATSGVAAPSPVPAMATAPARLAVTELVASAASSVTAPNFTPKLVAERLADVFKAGPLAKAAAVAALVKSGVGKSAAYAALKAGSRFAARLDFLADGRLAWKA
jgi:hypothetical protein